MSAHHILHIFYFFSEKIYPAWMFAEKTYPQFRAVTPPWQAHSSLFWLSGRKAGLSCGVKFPSSARWQLWQADIWMLHSRGHSLDASHWCVQNNTNPSYSTYTSMHYLFCKTLTPSLHRSSISDTSTGSESACLTTRGSSYHKYLKNKGKYGAQMMSLNVWSDQRLNQAHLTKHLKELMDGLSTYS